MPERFTVIGVDPGTANTGYAVIFGDSIEDFGMIRTKKTDGDVRKRIDTIGNELQKLIQEWKPDILAIEDFTEQGVKTGKTYKEMSWLTEHFRMTGKHAGIEVVIYKNGEWKKRLLGIQRASKVQVQHFVKRAANGAEKLQKAPDHVWDAAGIALCAKISARKHH